MQHQKHAKLARPALGHFHRREWAILGTTCGNIQQLAQAVASQLAPEFKTGYADAEHRDAAAETPAPVFTATWTDRISAQRFDRSGLPDGRQTAQWFSDLDLVLVNGNHFAAARQIVALDRRKFDSLQRKTERLTQVDLFITDASDPQFARPEDLPEPLRQHLPNWAEIPLLDRSDLPGLVSFLKKHLDAPPLRALLLAGGHSTRMGEDKAALHYHGRPQWQHLRDLLHDAGITDVRVSCRAEQAPAFAPTPVIADTFLDLGPMGALLSAFRAEPDTAWLVLACDLPLLDTATLRHLCAQRRPGAGATAFRQPGTGLPEPLVAIWEPASYGRLLQFLSQGVSCPRKVLLQSPAHLLDAPEPALLMNANTPGERAEVLEKLRR